MSDVTVQEDSVTTRQMRFRATTQERGEWALIDLKLYQAASEGDVALLEKLLNPEVEAHVQGETAIDVVAQAPREHNTVDFLSGVTPTGDTALHVAAYLGHLEVAKRICYENKQFLNRTNDKEETPLHYAAQAGNRKLVTFFIQLAEEDGTECVAELLRKRNQDGETALYQAIRHCQVLDIEEPRLFEQSRLAYIICGNTTSKTIRQLCVADENNHAAVAEELVRADLASASIHGNNNSMPRLASITDNNDISPLYLAITQSSLSIVTSLIGSLPENTPRAAYTGPDGQTALHAAAARSKDLAEKVLCWKPELTKSTDNFGSTPLHYAASLKSVETIKLLLEIDPTSAHIADSSGLYPIHVAAKLGDAQSVAVIFHQCPYSCELLDPEGRNFVHLAVKEKKTDVVSWACKNNKLAKQFNAQDNEGNTPMHLAVQAGSVNIFALLLGNQKINVCIMNKHGLTPKDLAAANRVREIFNHGQNQNFIIDKALQWIGCPDHGVYRFDLFLLEHNLLIDEKKKEKQAVEFGNMAKSIAVGSILIATGAFAGAAAISVSYKTSVQSGHVTPELSVAFKSFIIMTAYAFICSTAVTSFMVEAALNFLDDNYRHEYVVLCSRLRLDSIKGFIIAFALGVLVVMIQVSQWRLACLICLSCGVVPVLIQPHFWPDILVQRALIKYLGIKKFTLAGGFDFLRNIAYGIIILIVLLAARLSNGDLGERLVLTTIVAILLFISYPSIPVNRTTWIRTKYVTMFVDHRLFYIILVTFYAYLLLFL